MGGRGSTDGLILLDARDNFCTVEPDARAHVYLFARRRKVLATYIDIHI